MNDTPGAAFTQRPVRPLTRCTLDGAVYTRPPEVERQIHETASLTEIQLVARLAVTDNQSAQWLKEETLVYWLHEALLAGQNDLAERLAVTLNARIRQFVQAKVRMFVPSETDFSDCVQDCVTQLFTVLSHLGDKGAFAQVKFWRALDKIIIRLTQKYVRQATQHKDFVFLDDSDELSPEKLVAPDSLTSEKRYAVQQGLRQLNEPARTAFVLYHFHGWLIESQKPDVPTIANHFGTSGKTIRNWLRKADHILQKWRGETYE